MLNFKQYHCSPFFKVFILILYFSSVSQVFGQTDSLVTKSYEELTKLYSSTIHKIPEKAQIYIQAANFKAIKAKNSKQITDSYYGLAYAHYTLLEMSEALAYVEKTKEICEARKYNELLYQCYILEGNIKADQDKSSDAIDAYISAKEIAIETKSPLKVLNASSNIAYLRKMHNDYEEALSIYKDNLEKINTIDASEKAKNHQRRGILMNISDTYLRMQEAGIGEFTDKASHYNSLGLQLCSKTEFTYIYYIFLLNEVIIAFEKGNHTKSIATAEEVLAYATRIEDEAQRCTSYFYIGKNYYELKKYKQAILYLEKAYAIMTSSSRKYSNERLLHDKLAMSYTYVGNIKKTQFHLSKYGELQKEKNRTNINVISQIHNQNDVADLEKRIKEQEERIKTEKLRRKWLYIIAILLILLLVGSILFYRIKVKRVQKNIKNVLKRVTELEQLQEKNKTSTSTSISEKVTDKKAAQLLEKLQKFEEQKLFLQPDCSLSFVADQLQSNTSYVSNVINNYKNKTFKSYITELRINTALIQLKNNEKLHSYTIKAIAEEFGFKRQETFSKAFKAQTGVYPSQYVKKLREGNNN